MSNLQTRLRELRKARKLTQEEMAKRLREQYNLKTDRVMISKWETGFQTPEIYTITCIADLFNVSIDYLNGKSTSSNSQSSIVLQHPRVTEDYVTFPVIGDVAAGYDKLAVEDWSGDTVDVPSSYLRGRKASDYFVLKVVGDSMYPLYMDGDEVLILRQSTLNRSGEIGAILYDDENVTLKKVEYVQGEDWLRMLPINPEYMPKTIEGEALEHCRVLGVPVLLIREL